MIVHLRSDLIDIELINLDLYSDALRLKYRISAIITSLNPYPIVLPFPK